MDSPWTPWNVDIDRLITFISDRMYSDQAIAGIRELISNSIDAKFPNSPVQINIKLTTNSIEYADNGMGIQDFETTYGVIGSDKRVTDRASIGMFGIGRLALLARLKVVGTIVTRNKLAFRAWYVHRTGWEASGCVPTTIENIAQWDFGFTLIFPDLDLEIDVPKTIDIMEEIFSIPILENQCIITMNGRTLKSRIPEQHKKGSAPDYSYYWIVKEDGKIHYCHDSVEVRSESSTGIEIWINEHFLDIKTDREGFVNNKKYQDFLKDVKGLVISLRPKRTLQKLEVQFIENVMSKFRRYIKRKKPSVGDIIIQIPDKIEVFLDEDVSQNDSPFLDQSSLESKEYSETEIDTRNDSKVTYVARTDEPHVYHQIEESIVGESPTGPPGGEIESITEEKTPLETIEEGTDAAVSALQPSYKREKIIVKGTRVVDLKTEYPMIFFEQEPFTFIFNTTHPILKGMIENETLDKQKLGIIFERMLESVYFKSETDMESIKRRWTDVDTSLQAFL